jgi:hypothetical protein
MSFHSSGLNGTDANSPEPGVLRVRVNDDLTLDAGTCEQVDASGREVIIRPPKVALFRQLLEYLDSKPSPVRAGEETAVGSEGIAAAALVLRWGTYLCVLADQSKPAWPEISNPAVSRVSDKEMARINIEASAALAEWIDMLRQDLGGMEHALLVEKAIAYLPMPKPISPQRLVGFAALADPDVAATVKAAAGAKAWESVAATEHSTRILSNALINVAWRYGPIEDIHGGQFRGHPLDMRRISPSEERRLLSVAGARLAFGLSVCHEFVAREGHRPWGELVAPYGLAEDIHVTPIGWSLTEASREVSLQTAAM